MNPYDVLGVAPGASDEEIARAYKKLAKQYHPDLNPGSDFAAQKMGEINRAYDDVKAMRQRGESYHTYYNNSNPGRSAYENPFDPFYAARRTYTYRYNYNSPRPHSSPLAFFMGIILVVFVVRLFMTLLFGGYSSAYYTGEPAVPGGYMPYGYYQTVP